MPKKSLTSAIMVLVFLSAFFYSQAFAIPLEQVPPFPSTVSVQVYELNSDGESTGVLCLPGSKRWGCTAYCTDIPGKCNTSREVAFPYSPDNHGYVQVLSNRYLLDVISQEMNPSIFFPETAAITAQAVASRSLAGYLINNP